MPDLHLDFTDGYSGGTELIQVLQVIPQDKLHRLKAIYVSFHLHGDLVFEETTERETRILTENVQPFADWLATAKTSAPALCVDRLYLSYGFHGRHATEAQRRYMCNSIVQACEIDNRPNGHLRGSANNK